jgi:hypothetical protein
MAKQKQPINVVQPSAAVELIVLPKTVATLTLANAAPTAKAGTQAEILVRVTRLFDYGGELKVQFEMPPKTKGISADPGTIPAGKNEAKLILKVAPDVAPGNVTGLIVRATAVLHGNVPVVQETKFNLNVLKP